MTQPGSAWQCPQDVPNRHQQLTDASVDNPTLRPGDLIELAVYRAGADLSNRVTATSWLPQRCRLRWC